jgi:Tfp pilus assembly protein PilX
MTTIRRKQLRSQSGIALLTTILLMLLMASMLVGFIILINSGQQVSGMNNDYSKAFYAAEAGMEQLTAGLGTLFDSTYSPSGAQISAITSTPPNLSGVSYVRFDGSSGYTISYPVDANGNPAATNTTIKSGPYQGMTALATAYTLNVTARTNAGSEVKLQRTTQTVGIPMFQFGIFSDMDLSFFPGPSLEFGGRTHTNGNLFLAANSGPVYMDDRVTAAKDIVRANLANGYTNTSSSYGGSIYIANTTGASFRANGNTNGYLPLGLTQGSVVGMPGSTANGSWSTIAAAYNGYLRNKSQGVTPLNLGIVTVGGGSTQPIDIIRRPVSGESLSITNERYYSQASLKILLSDNPNDIMGLPCIDTSTQPFDLSLLANNPASWTGTAATLYTLMTAKGAGYQPLPLAASGAASGSPSGAYTSTDGYWLPAGNPIIKGFIKIEAQYPYSTSCNTWHDVTLEILSLGYAGRNIHPVPQSLDGSTLNPDWPATNGTTTMQAPNNQSLPFGPSSTSPYQNQTAIGSGSAGSLYTGPSMGACPDPHPNAVIRLERVRDNPSSIIALGYQAIGTRKTTSPVNLPKQATVKAVCGVDPSTGNWVSGATPLVTDFWPNVIFDPREGSLRDTAPSGAFAALPTLNGSMNYIELDAANLAKWFSGTIGSTGSNTYDVNTAPNDFVVYISDRRGNHVTSATWAGSWPPLSPQNDETGEYGWNDVVNSPANPATGCPNKTLDVGEDFDGTAQLYIYGADPTYTMKAGTALASLTYGQYGTFNGLLGTALVANPTCSAPSYGFGSIWPMVYANAANAARENPPLFFRRAVKIVNGANLLGSFSGNARTNCAGTGNPCGLTIASENPVYVQGNYNCPTCASNTFDNNNVASSIAADAVTFLSNNWNDANSFLNPYSEAARKSVTSYYRAAIIAGKNVSFAQPSGMAADYGTDGGIHNFLRYIEDWGGQTLNYTGSLVSEYYSRQAIGNYKCCNTVYNAPSRGYYFDVEFLTPALLPPRTPLFRDVNTTGFTQLLLPTQ